MQFFDLCVILGVYYILIYYSLLYKIGTIVSPHFYTGGYLNIFQFENLKILNFKSLTIYELILDYTSF